MPASYVHQCVAHSACDALSLYTQPRLRNAVLAGSEGPDPLFFSVLLPTVPRIASMIHTSRTDDFLIALADACAASDITRAYCCGFFTHYAADTVIHPYVYARSLTPQGVCSVNVHCTLEQQIETLFFRRQGHASGLPVQMAGIAALSGADRSEIARALTTAIRKVFPDDAPAYRHIRASLDNGVHISALLRSERGVWYRVLAAMLRPLRMDALVHAHMMPAEPPAHDIMNDAHNPWSSLWTPSVQQNESFEDLYAAAVQRAQALVSAADGYMLGNTSYAALRTLHGGFSYHSGLPWQTSCAAKDAPGAARS